MPGATVNRHIHGLDERQVQASCPGFNGSQGGIGSGQMALDHRMAFEIPGRVAAAWLQPFHHLAAGEVRGLVVLLSGGVQKGQPFAGQVAQDRHGAVPGLGVALAPGGHDGLGLLRRPCRPIEHRIGPHEVAVHGHALRARKDMHAGQPQQLGHPGSDGFDPALMGVGVFDHRGVKQA